MYPSQWNWLNQTRSSWNGFWNGTGKRRDSWLYFNFEEPFLEAILDLLVLGGVDQRIRADVEKNEKYRGVVDWFNAMVDEIYERE